MSKESESIKNLIAVCNQLGRDVAIITHEGIKDYYLISSFNVLENFIEVSGINIDAAIDGGIFNAQFLQTGGQFTNVLDTKLQSMLSSPNVRVKYDKTATYKIYCK